MFLLTFLPTPICRGLSRSCWNTLLSSLSWTSSTSHSSPTPFLSVSSQYLETHLTQNYQWPHLSGSQKIIPYQTIHNHHTLIRIREGNRNQGMKQQPNQDKTRYEHLELQFSQSQMPRRQSKNTINNSQDNMPPLEPATLPQQPCVLQQS